MIDAMNEEQRERIETCKKVIRGEPIDEQQDSATSDEEKDGDDPQEDKLAAKLRGDQDQTESPL